MKGCANCQGVTPRADALDRMAAALTALPERQRGAFLLARFEGYTTAQIAERLHCSLPEARAAVVDAVASLSERIERIVTRSQYEADPAGMAALIERGITPVVVPDEDPDHQGSVWDDDDNGAGDEPALFPHAGAQP